MFPRLRQCIAAVVIMERPLRGNYSLLTSLFAFFSHPCRYFPKLPAYYKNDLACEILRLMLIVFSILILRTQRNHAEHCPKLSFCMLLVLWAVLLAASFTIVATITAGHISSLCWELLKEVILLITFPKLLLVGHVVGIGLLLDETSAANPRGFFFISTIFPAMHVATGSIQSFFRTYLFALMILQTIECAAASVLEDILDLPEFVEMFTFEPDISVVLWECLPGLLLTHIHRLHWKESVEKLQRPTRAVINLATSFFRVARGGKHHPHASFPTLKSSLQQAPSGDHEHSLTPQLQDTTFQASDQVKASNHLISESTLPTEVPMADKELYSIGVGNTTNKHKREYARNYTA